MTILIIQLLAAGCAATLRAPLLRPVPRAAVVASAQLPPALELVDVDGDEIVFCLEDDNLQMFVHGELYCEVVDTIEYATSDGRVRQNEGEGNFQLLDGPERAEQVAALKLLALAAGAAYRESDVLPELELGEADEEAEAAEGEDPDSMAALLAAADGVELPPEVDAMLAVSEELQEQRPGVLVLWSRLLAIYPDEPAALAAVQRNSALVMPYLNKPAFIDGSWAVLLEMMPPADALEVVTKNPGILASNPAGLRMSDADTIKRAAGFVDGVENVLDPVRKIFFPKDS